MSIGSWLRPQLRWRGTLVDDGGTVIRARDCELGLWTALSELPSSTAHRLPLSKDRRSLSALASTLDRVGPKRMVEVGIYRGGSTIYWAERYNLEPLIAFDLAATSPYLTQYLERHGLLDRVRVHFSVSQDDK